jgi:amino acid adenylation domain-containing protein
MQEFEAIETIEHEAPANDRNGLEIAIVGISGRFPGAKNVHQFWENLKNEVHSIRFFTDEELLASPNFDPQYLQAPNFVRAKGVLEEVEYFDAYFFGYSPVEAEVLDPQIRLFYEVCWEALEDSACSPNLYDGSIGVYAGGSSNLSWEVLALLSGKDKKMGGFQAGLMTDKDYLSTRIAHKLDLKGPAISIHTACSTALVAVDLACRGLLTGQCDAALAGGVSVLAESARGGGYLYEKGLIYSKDGYVRAFDKDAGGVIFSHGAGAIVLKRLDDALNEGDSIYAVIKGFASNNDGLAKSSFSAPAIDGQASCIQAAMFMAEVEPETVTYVETHGTGTELGDPIEVEALISAFDTDKQQYCAIGSLKTNIGHLDTAAGIAGMIKVVLMMKHRQIPASLHFKTPNPGVDFQDSPFFVNTKLREWQTDGFPLRAGISSFGVGGTNAHVILEEPPQLSPVSPGRQYRPVLLSARTTKGLEQKTLDLIDYLAEHKDLNIDDVAYSLNIGRKSFEHKRMLIATSLDDLRTQMSTIIEDKAGDTTIQDHYEKDEKRAVFMFPGQGSQYIDMGLELYHNEAIFREEMDRCFAILTPLMNLDIKDILYPETSGASGVHDSSINQTYITQPLLFAFQYSLARLIMSWGIRPYAMIGHSIGEYTAACISGVFTLEEALGLVVWRGKLMQDMPEGGMLSVPMANEKLAQILPQTLELAAINGPGQCVVSGTHDAIDAFTKELSGKDIQYRKLHTSHAFHSRMMDPILEIFRQKVAQYSPSEPQIPFISNVTGTWITYEDACSPDYWVRHLRGTVQFSSGASALLEERHSIFIEVGPGRTLSTFLRQHTDKKPEQQLVNLVRHPKEDIADDYYLISRLAQAWLFGFPVDWRQYYEHESRRRLHLPTYPFQRQPYWLNGNPTAIIRSGVQGAFEPVKNTLIEEWFYVPSWKPSALPVYNVDNDSHWLVLTGSTADSSMDPFISRLRQTVDSQYLTEVQIGAEFKELGSHSFTVSPANEKDFELLFSRLIEMERIPQKILHTWVSLDSEKEDILDTGFYSLLYIVRSIAQLCPGHKIELNVLTRSLQEVWGQPVSRPEQAVVLGPLQVIPLEYPGFRCRCIDIADFAESAFTHIYKELNQPINLEQPIIAYRDNYRFIKTYESMPIPPAANDKPIRLTQGGVYLITGGLGGIGLVLAQWLARTLHARLALTGRSFFPEKKERDHWLNTHAGLDPVSRKIRKVKELEALGAEVMVFSVDVTDLDGMRQVMEHIARQWGELNGIVHSAGLPGGGIIQLKTREMADNVLMPKIKGAQILAEILADKPLDFFILCSSVNSVVPVIGQVDYFSGNAFMDAFAYHQTAKFGSKRPSISINWDAWQEVGMAVDAARQNAGTGNRSLDPIEVTHPLLDYYQIDPVPGAPGKEGYTFTTYFSVQRHWVMSEHRSSDGNGIVPGVTYLEMVHAAMQTLEPNNQQIVEIRDVSFHTPLIAVGDEEKETLLRFTPIDNDETKGYQFNVRSRIQPGTNRWETHATGQVVWTPAPAQFIQHNIEMLKNRCNLGEREIELNWGEESESRLLRFGPRWGNLRVVRLGNNEALAEMELPGDYNDELQQFTLYPSLLDIAAAFLSGCVTPRPYIPYSYKKLRVFRPLPRCFYAYGSLAEPFDENGNTDFIKFNVSLMDNNGTELVAIESFTMMEISEEILNRLKAKEQGTLSTSSPGTAGEEDTGSNQGDHYNQWIKNGIAPDEGVDALVRILGQSMPQIVVSTRDLESRFKTSRAINGETMGSEMHESGSGETLHERPDIGAPFIEPGNETEEKLANIWQELLGIDRVGVKDDFFELGGDSLKAATLIGKIKQTFNMEISVTEIFTHPNIRSLSSQISPQVEETGPVTPAYQGIQPIETQPYYPLSPMQKRIYVLSRLDRTATAYHLPYVLILEEEPDTDKIHEAFRVLIHRHESLRTSFKMEGEQPVQIIHDADEMKLEIRRKDESCQDELPEILVRRLIRAFDLEKAPLMRIYLVALKDGTYLMIFDIHHIIIDGYSYMVLIKEFRQLMVGDNNLPQLPIQYKDYAHWFQGESGQAVINAQESFWLEQYIEPAPILNLPTDFPRPAVQQFSGDKVSFVISTELTRQLKTLAKEENVTLFMVLLAIYYIFLAKLSGQEDIVIGSPVAGRNRPEIHEVIGMFVNTLAIRSFPSQRKPFREFLQEVKTHTLDALENQAYPFEILVEKITLKRDASRNPLFDVMFDLQSQLIEWEHSFAREVDVNLGVSKFDLTLTVIEEQETLKCFFEYCTGLFKTDTIQRFTGYLEHIVTEVLLNPAILQGDIQLISPKMKEQILNEFNSTKAGYSLDQTLTQLFREQVQRTPHLTVLHSSLGPDHPHGSQKAYVTYRFLDNQSDSVAYDLIEKGIRAGDIVAIKMSRSIEYIVAILAILKSGAAYLPIDPDYPKERIDFMLYDSKAQLCLQSLDLNRDTTGSHEDKFSYQPVNTDLAYVIYTSGSTGKPKGVMVEHRQVCNLVNGMQGRYYRENDQRLHFALNAPFVFDASVYQMYPALLFGHVLFLVPDAIRRDSFGLLAFYKSYGIQVAEFTPSHLRSISAAKEAMKPNRGPEPFDLQYILLGGEELPIASIRQFWKNHFSHLNRDQMPLIFNSYGPTECCVAASTYTIDTQLLEGDFSIGRRGSVPIGSPLANQEIYIVDSFGSLQPIGVAGEIVITGQNVARGYLNNPELTHQKFISFPITGQTSIAYKTGDLAYWLQDGNIVFLGRIDHQVKIRGFRIELGEIQASLILHKDIKDVEVFVIDSSAGDKVICAYIVPGTGVKLEPDDLRGYLARQLPQYMIPAYFVFLDGMPMTVSGKLDRHALPAPGIEKKKEFKPPRNEKEKIIADAWGSVLGIPQVSIDDDFFQLGGDSIKAVQISARLNTMGLKLDINDIFIYPDIATLSSYVEKVETSSLPEEFNPESDTFSGIATDDLEELEEDLQDLD